MLRTFIKKLLAPLIQEVIEEGQKKGVKEVLENLVNSEIP